MAYYIYNFDDYLRIKENPQDSVLNVRNVYANYSEQGYTTEQLKEIFSNCLNIESISIYYGNESSEFEIPDEIALLKKLGQVYLTGKVIAISEKIAELPLYTLHIETTFDFFKLPESLANLTNLQQLRLAISQITLPSFEKYTQLQYLEIKSKRFVNNFETIEFVKNSLTNLTIDAPMDNEQMFIIQKMEKLQLINLSIKGVTIIPSLAKLKKLDTFNLTSDEVTIIEGIPSVNYQLQLMVRQIQKIHFLEPLKVQHFNFRGNFDFSFDFENLQFLNARYVYLTNCGNKTIPTFSTTLQTLYLENIPNMEALPDLSTTELNQLILKGMPFLTSLESANLNQTQLRHLELNALGITEIPSLPTVKIYSLQVHNCLALTQDDFTILMNVGPERFTFDHLKFKPKHEDVIFKFVYALSKSSLDLEDKKKFYDAYLPFLNKTSKKQLNWTKTEILKLSSINLKVIQQEVLQAIQQHVEKDTTKNPFTKEAKLAIAGTTGTKKTEIKQRVSELGITYQTKIQEDTTHVIIGKSIKEFDFLENVTWISEQQVTDFLNDKGETPYLLEETENKENQENVLQLLLAGGDNALVALEILAAGGVPKDLLVAILYVQKTDENPKVKDKAKKLLLANAPLYFQDALADRGRFTLTKSEKDLSKHLIELSKKVPQIDWVQFAMYYHQRHEKGLRFVFDKTKKDHPLRKEILNNLVEHSKLDLFKALIKRIPAYHDFYSYESYTQREDNIPKEVFDMVSLQELSLKGFTLGEVPKEIEKLENLRTLDLSSNLLHELPDEMVNLQKLENLILSDNEFKKFPMIIGELKNLKKVEIKGNRKGYEDAFFQEIPDEIKEKLPNCTFIYN